MSTICICLFLAPVIALLLTIHARLVGVPLLLAAGTGACAWLLTATMIAASSLWLIVRFGWAQAAPGSLEARSFRGVLEGQLWALADVVPGLDIAGTLGWSRPSVIQGSVVGVILVGFRMSAFVVLVMLSFLLVRLGHEHLRDPWRPLPVDSAREYARLLRSLESKLQTPEAMAASDRIILGEMTRLRACRRAVSLAFGDGAVSAAADTALDVVQARARELLPLYRGASRFTTPGREWRRATASREAFVAAATAALWAAIPPVVDVPVVARPAQDSDTPTQPHRSTT